MSNLFNEESKKYITHLKSKYSGKKIGFTCSCFDLFHAGHVLMLKDAKQQCDILIVGLQTDPTIDRKWKNNPIMSLHERRTMIDNCKYIDNVITYATESDLVEILKNLRPDVRILGTDYKNKFYTGKNIGPTLGIEIYWHDRTRHNYNSTDLRNRIFMAEKNKRSKRK